MKENESFAFDEIGEKATKIGRTETFWNVENDQDFTFIFF
jgi:hypothetical protein